MSKSNENRNHVERDRTAKAFRDLKEAAGSGPGGGPSAGMLGDDSTTPGRDDDGRRRASPPAGSYEQFDETKRDERNGGPSPKFGEFFAGLMRDVVWGMAGSANSSARVDHGSATLADPGAASHEAARS